MSRPNVIVFFTDQQRWDTTGIHGNPLDLTPNFDRMAKYGTHLETLITCQPVCGPARACLQSGQYATTTGCYRNSIPLPEHTRTLAHSFKDAGYRTGYIGKWHLAHEEPVTEPRRGGYEYWLGAELLEFTSDAYETILFDNDNKPVKLPGYRVDAMTDAAIRYVADASGRQEPFFLFLSYLEPHHQNHSDDYPAPDAYADMYRDAWTPPDLQTLVGTAPRHLPGYYGMVRKLDEALGRLLDALKSMRLDENTIVLFTSDHGNHFKTRNGEYKRSPHESAVRVPGAIMGPGFRNGGAIRELISLIDLPPTLLDGAGLPVPEHMQGRSLMPLVRRESAEWPQEAFIQISESCVGRAIRTKRWKYAVVAPDLNGADHAGSDRYVEQFLYDLHADPYELENLAGVVHYRAVADELKAALIRRMMEAGEAEPAIENAASRRVGQRRPAFRDVYGERWSVLDPD